MIVQVHYPNHHTGMCTWCVEEVFPCLLHRAALALLRNTDPAGAPGATGPGDPVTAPHRRRRRGRGRR